MSYEVRLDIFEGPLDLLLHLITRQRVDIYDVSLATITDEFVAAVDQIEPGDLERTTGFLVVAATLLELKSARLLPSASDDPSSARLLEERDLLLARLVECATFRSAGGWIAAGLAAGATRHGRAVSLEDRFIDIAPDLLAQVALDDVVRRAAFVLAPAPVIELDTSHVAPIRASVRDAIEELGQTLEQRGSATFETLCSAELDRIDVIVRFLALLELFKAGAIELDQADRFGAITATWTGAGIGEALELADEYVAVDAARNP